MYHFSVEISNSLQVIMIFCQVGGIAGVVEKYLNMHGEVVR
jgi:hypothetical protein